MIIFDATDDISYIKHIPRVIGKIKTGLFYDYIFYNNTYRVRTKTDYKNYTYKLFNNKPIKFLHYMRYTSLINNNLFKLL